MVTIDPHTRGELASSLLAVVAGVQSEPAEISAALERIQGDPEAAGHRRL